MGLNLSMADTNSSSELCPRITVFGVGGAGGNAVDNMIAKELQGVEFVVANTDAQALTQANAPVKIQLGARVTEGLGAGAKPEVGAHAAAESIEEIVDNLSGVNMCFITAGMGGGTGTGAAPVIAKAAREMGILTVGVVTKPFQFEGTRRMKQAEAGIEELQKVVDTLIIIPNQNLFRLATERTTFTEAFALADDVLYQGVKGVTDLMISPGIINLDFNDIRSVMDEMGKAMMGTGEGSGENRAIEAAEHAIANPLLDEVSLKGAKGVLINIIGGQDLTLLELDEAANMIREQADPDANIIVGSTVDPNYEGKMRISVVATGIDVEHAMRTAPNENTGASATTAKAPEQAAPAGGAFEPSPEEIVAEMAEETPAAVTASPAPTRGPDPATAAEIVAGLRENSARPMANRRPGEPSPEVMARRDSAARLNPQAAPETSATAPADKPAAGGRFGIPGLIGGLISGQREAQPRREPVVSVAPELPPLQAEEAEPQSDIPAFLRRQAN